MTAQEFAAMHGITVSSRPIPTNPYMPDETMDHWLSVLKMGELGTDFRELTTEYSKGSAFNGEPPTAAEIIETLAMDASYVDYENFEEWCDLFGYNPDSRQAERLFLTMKEKAKDFRRFLGPELFNTLLEESQEW